MPPLPCLRFRHRTVIELTPVLDLLTGTERALKLRELHEKADRREREGEWLRVQSQSEAESAIPSGIQPGPVATLTHPLGDFGYRPGWHGIEGGKPVCVHQICPHGAGLRLDFSDTLSAVVNTGDVELCPHPAGAVAVPVPLEDAPLSATLLDPVRCFFRRAEEVSFWEGIVEDSLDFLARIVYADWLDDHDDGYGWVFREPRPFRLGNSRFDWLGAMGRVDCRQFVNRRLWQYARVTGRGSSVPFKLSDGNPVPQYVAYLLGVTRHRAEVRISAGDRGLIADQTHVFGFSLMGDLIVGPDDEPICRITNTLRTIYFLGEMMDRSDVTTSEVLTRLREINHP